MMPPCADAGGALRIAGISKIFGTTAVLDDVSLAAAPGEFVALVGPSGCGKSTFLRIIAGLEQPDQGQVWLDGQDVTARRAADRDMAMVFQSYALYPHLTTRQNLALPLAMRRLSTFERLPILGRLSTTSQAKRAAIQRDVAEAAASLKISDLLDRKPGQMSGGQRQRVALGRAMVRHPRAFLMDEPLSNLDAALRVHMRNEIVELHRKAGVVTIYVTHDQEEALGMADRVAVMLAGRIVQVASPADIYRTPTHLDVATFIGSPRINLLPAEIDALGHARCSGHVLASGFKPGHASSVTLGIRPENLHLQTSVHPNSLPLRVERVEFLGAQALAHCRADGVAEPLIASLSPAVAAELASAPVLYASALPGAILAFDASGARIDSPSQRSEASSHAA